ncbi:hypothetical protein SAMN05445756_0313 [Kytococcus aerolatus]|uniref:Uncharacterized protein n=1 Tax=Kytococcus aerolatus TaxID=592308 RepID=A0A212T4A8_9MICO|nr:hypothetical protein [Kytococcus aerolatus]SNC60604.1 hypothetical protein SAMN05445756_0313 [Kytococcus aerolatus]
MQKNRRAAAAIGLALITALGSTSAFAGTVFSTYNTTVGNNNGKGYTGYQKKYASNRAGDLHSRTVGGSYKVDARMLPGGTGISGVTDSSSYKLNNTISRGDSTRVEFNNGIFTPVDVQVTGTWRSN